MPTAPPTHTQRFGANRTRPTSGHGPVLRDAVRFRNSARWQRFRRWFKARHLFCCDPFGHHHEDGTTVMTEHVHHIEPLQNRPDLACVEANCAPLCVTCHGKIEAMERRGEPTQHLFRGWQQELEPSGAVAIKGGG